MIMKVHITRKMSFVVIHFIAFASLVVFCSAACSKGVYETGVPKQDQDFIVNKHNELRLLIARGKLQNQPRGVNLKRLKWSPILAQKAQEISNTCKYGHQSVKGTPWGWVGQNIYDAKRSNYIKGTDWNSVIYGWWDEYKIYKFNSGFAKSTGHYTQMAWANTEYVGCGYTHFPSEDPNFKYERFYVCNYGPGGNIGGQAPYKTGNSGCENLC